MFRNTRAPRLIAVAIGVLTASVLLAPAQAATVTISDTDLEAAQGDATFDPNGSFDYDQCFYPDDDGFMGAEDGESATLSDAFDGGLMHGVGNQVFDVPSDEGDLVGQQLYSKGGVINGLQTARFDKAMAATPVLRSLLRLKNTTNQDISRKIVWDSGLGSDNDGRIRATSSGDKTWSPRDRWMTTSDDATSPSDPAIGFQFFGKGNVRSQVEEILYRPAADACTTVELRVRVPAKSTRYLLFYTALTDSNNGAKNQISNVDDKPNLRGISKTARKQVLNWNLA
jgi:hypothetical protein